MTFVWTILNDDFENNLPVVKSERSQTVELDENAKDLLLKLKGEWKLDANAFGMQSLELKADSGTFTLKKDEVVLLKHRIIFHEGDEKAAGIAEAYRAYADSK